MDELDDRARTLILSPEWYAGDILPDSVPISQELRTRLRTWNHTWETVLDPVFEVRWPDPDVGRKWIAEGQALVRDLRSELGPSIRVVGDFEGYDPDAGP